MQLAFQFDLEIGATARYYETMLTKFKAFQGKAGLAQQKEDMIPMTYLAGIVKLFIKHSCISKRNLTGDHTKSDTLRMNLKTVTQFLNIHDF